MAVTNFFWDESNLLQEYDDSGATVAHYVTEPNQYGNLISQRRNGQSQYYHFDATGSTVELTDGSATVSDSWRYMAFGAHSDSIGATICPFQFMGNSGSYLDLSAALIYVRARHYDLQRGRWLSFDPHAFLDDSFNVFQFLRGNPTNRCDPSGKDIGGAPPVPGSTQPTCKTILVERADNCAYCLKDEKCLEFGEVIFCVK